MTMKSDSNNPGVGRGSISTDCTSSEMIGIIDSLDTPVVVIRLDFTVASFNRAAAEVLEFSPADIGRQPHDTHSLVTVYGIEALCAQVIADSTTCRREFRIGQRSFILTVAPFLTDKGEIQGAVLTFTNVTAFRASIDQAIYEREYTKRVLNTVIVPLVVLDYLLRVQTANRAFYDLFGVAREAIQGVPLSEFGDEEWTNSTLWEDLKATLEEGRPFQTREIEREFRIIGRRTVLLDAQRLSDKNDATIILTLQDVTERKRAEDSMRRANLRKDEFLATLAHELRNPLAPLRNSIQILRMAGGVRPGEERVHEMMERQVAHMVRLVDDLLELSRINRGAIELRKERVDLAVVMQHALETSKPAIESGGHHLTVSLPDEPVYVDADLVRLSQVFSNILNNAAKYTQNGGYITVRVSAADSIVDVSIRDNGIGIPRDMLSKVFDLFAQADNVLSRSHEGLGIGLHLVLTLVAMHGGSVHCESAGIGQGSEFVVRLPRAEQVGLTQVAAGAQSYPHAVPVHRILLVDDNKDNADSLGMLLKFLGAEVQIAYDGPSALEALKTARPSLILLDIGLPGMDGYEVARRIRQMPEFANIMLIALTGWGQEEDRRRTREAGFDHHLVKPVELDALQGILSSVEMAKTSRRSA
jgi:PAS domain S-box-containing protein